MAEPEQINAWIEAGHRWFHVVYNGHAYVRTESRPLMTHPLPWYPISLTTWISTEYDIRVHYEDWQFYHEDWVRRGPPYGRL